MNSYTQRLSNKSLAIFLFHGVIERSSYRVRNYTKKHIKKDGFVRLMNELCEAGQPMTMDAVVEHHRAGKPFPPGAFVISFDDGFENNFSVAAPVLDELHMPAIFYVTTDFVDRNTMSWIDQIEYCLEFALDGSLRLPWDSSVRSFSTAEERIGVLEDIRAHVKRDERIDQVAFVKDIFSQCSVPQITSSDDPLDRKMNWAQVRQLSENPLFTVGGHSHRHAILSFLSSQQLEEEVSTSCDFLKQRAGIMPMHYSYPEGMEHCYTDKVITVLKQHGVICCPSAEDGVNNQSTDLFHLKRIFVV